MDLGFAPMDFQSSFHRNPTQDTAFIPHSSSLFPGMGPQDPINEDLSSYLAVDMPDAASWPWLHESLYLPQVTDSSFQKLGAVYMHYAGPTAFDISPVGAMANPAQTPSAVSDLSFYGQLPMSMSTDNTAFASRSAAQPDSSNLGQGLDPGTSIGNYSHLRQDPLTRSANPGPSTNSQESPSRIPGSVSGSQYQVQTVQALINVASTPNGLLQPDTNRTSSWCLLSTKVADAFEIGLDPGVPLSSTLDHFCDLYFTNFGPLWPLLTSQNLDLGALHPLLFLVLTSIGAMYGGAPASSYGVLMHNHIRRTLTIAFELDEGETDLIWLAQARLLTQVSALYFGQPKAFTYSQHLGALIVAQARRMDLFSVLPTATLMAKFQELKGKVSDSERLAIWLQVETRRRLAFGIFRAEIFTSILLHTKPLVLLEEIDLEFPLCDAVWRADPLPPALCLQMIEHDQTPGRQLRASDIYRIALESREVHPPLDPAGQELLAFGLQYPVWRFSRDQEMFDRLTGGENDSAATTNMFTASDSYHNLSPPGRPKTFSRFPMRIQKAAAEKEAHHLDSSSRSMADLRLERERLIMALEKWESALPVVKGFTRTEMDRTSLLSGLLLYHLAYLRLHAPIEDLHQIQYHLADNRSVDRSLVATVRSWANSTRGQLAAGSACHIWSMIAREAQRKDSQKARFNLLTFIGLHHSATLLWAYAGAHNDLNDVAAVDENMDYDPLVLAIPNARRSPIPIVESQTATILRSFVELYNSVSHAQWSSFAKAADKLSTQRFPAA